MSKKKRVQPMSPSSPAPLSEQPEHLESMPPSLVTAQVPDGLVPAGQLPSAADVLAQLFPSEESDSRSAKFAPLSSRASMFVEENSFPYESPLAIPLPPFDPYSLGAELEAPLADRAVPPVS